MSTMILKCTCIHPGQDLIYGKGRRVHNSKDKTHDPKIYRCTICKEERTDHEPVRWSYMEIKRPKFKKGKKGK